MKKSPFQKAITSAAPSPSAGSAASAATTARTLGRRSFLRNVGLAAAAAVPASAILMAPPGVKAWGRGDHRPGRLTKGDAAIQRFLAAAEIIESDLWEQYWELVGIHENDFASTDPTTGVAPSPPGGNATYTAALQLLDGDMPQYILDNIPMMSSVTRTSYLLT